MKGRLIFIILILVLCGCTNKEISNKNIEKNSSTLNKNLSLINKTKNKAKNFEEIKKEENKKSEKNITDKKINYFKELNMEDMFLNLSYTFEIKENNKIIKKYKNITFIVSKEPLDFSEAFIFNKVYTYHLKDGLGSYTLYKFVPLSKNVSISYCYYQNIGLYSIALQTYKVDEETNNLWLKWRKHILSLLKVKN
ncbi:hypothetical protein [Methanocaldococcus sp.]